MFWMNSAISIAPRTWFWREEFSCRHYSIVYTPHLTTNSGDTSLVSLQGAHVDAVLDDQRRYRDQGKDQHVQDEQLLATA